MASLLRQSLLRRATRLHASSSVSFAAPRVCALLASPRALPRALFSRPLSSSAAGGGAPPHAPPPGDKAAGEAGGAEADAGVDEPILARASRLIWAGIKTSAGIALIGGLLYCGYNIVMVLLPVRE